jgi:hypothetical protein
LKARWELANGSQDIGRSHPNREERILWLSIACGLYEALGPRFTSSLTDTRKDLQGLDVNWESGDLARLLESQVPDGTLSRVQELEREHVRENELQTDLEYATAAPPEPEADDADDEERIGDALASAAQHWLGPEPLKIQIEDFRIKFGLCARI